MGQAKIKIVKKYINSLALNLKNLDKAYFCVFSFCTWFCSHILYNELDLVIEFHFHDDILQTFYQ